MKAPGFWNRRTAGPLALALSPLGAVYGLVTSARATLGGGWRAPVPVVCVGNIAGGGTGKTPIALSLADHLRDLGVEPHFLSRGYGGRLSGPVRVNSSSHDASDVGDEPLLLARKAVTWIARDRARGAAAAVEAGAQAIIMDDGLQNPGLIKDLSLIVVDGRGGFGNGLVMPAGPLREGIDAGLARVSAVILVGDDEAGVEARIAGQVPVLKARFVARAPDIQGRAVAFAGIGDPDKFFKTAAETGLTIVDRIAFADHHPYSENDLDGIVERAAALGASAITTEKDWVRIAKSRRAAFRSLAISVIWDDTNALGNLLQRVFP